MNKTQNQSTFLLGSALRLSVWLIYDLSFKLFYIYKMLSLVFRTKQIPGTLVKVWYQSDNTSKSKLSTHSIYSRNYAVSMEARATGINGYVFYNSLEDGETEITYLLSNQTETLLICTHKRSSSSWHNIFMTAPTFCLGNSTTIFPSESVTPSYC